MLNGQKLQGPLAAKEVHMLLQSEGKESEWVNVVSMCIMKKCPMLIICNQNLYKDYLFHIVIAPSCTQS